VIALLSGIGIVWSWQKIKKKRYKCLILIIYFILLLFLFPFIVLFMERAGFIQDSHSLIRGRYNKHKPTEFFKIKEEINIRLNLNDEYNEYFVISNPPEDTLQLKGIIEEYNFQTLPTGTVRKYKIHREFYEETECLTRNYEEGKPYPRDYCQASFLAGMRKQELRYHSRIFETGYYFIPHERSWVYYYSYTRGDSIREVYIKDIDLFYEENGRTRKIP
jgi:hypothetical protein